MALKAEYDFPLWALLDFSVLLRFSVTFLPDFDEYSKQQVLTQTKFLSRLGVRHDAAVLAIQSQTQTTVYCFV